eukprot:767102-Hanusia_phi.AAC.3
MFYRYCPNSEADGIGLDACQEILAIKYRTVKMSLEKDVLEWCDAPANLDLWLVFPSAVKELYSCLFTSGNVTAVHGLCLCRLSLNLPSGPFPRRTSRARQCACRREEGGRRWTTGRIDVEHDESSQISNSAFTLPDGAYALYLGDEARKSVLTPGDRIVDGPRHVISPCPAGRSNCVPGEFLLQSDSTLAFGSVKLRSKSAEMFPRVATACMRLFGQRAPSRPSKEAAMGSTRPSTRRRASSVLYNAYR